MHRVNDNARVQIIFICNKMHNLLTHLIPGYFYIVTLPFLQILILGYHSCS